MRNLVAFLALMIATSEVSAEKRQPAAQNDKGSQQKSSNDSLKLDRSAYIKVVENKLDTWEEMLSDIRAGTYKDKDFGENTTPEEAKRLAETLESDKKIVSEHLERLKNSEGDKWIRERQRVEAHFDQMDKRFGQKLAD